MYFLLIYLISIIKGSLIPVDQIKILIVCLYFLFLVNFISLYKCKICIWKTHMDTIFKIFVNILANDLAWFNTFYA